MKAFLASAIGLILLILIIMMINGCSLAPSDKVLHELMTSDRSWFFSVTSIYGTVRMGGSGAKDSQVIINQEGLKIDGSGGGSHGVTGSASAIIIPPQPRVYVHEAPALQEVDPNVFERARRKP